MKLYRRALDFQEKNIARAFTVAEDSRRLAYAKTLIGSTHIALSFHLQAAPDHRPTAELALTTLLRRKGRTLDLIAQSNAALRASLPEEHQHLFDDISDIEAQIAAQEGGALDSELRKLQQKQDELWSELRKYGALARVLDRPVTIADIQAALPADGVLVEFVKYIPRYDDAGAYIRKHETKPPSRYAVYLVFPDRFDWVDLGPTDLIDQHVASFRKALQLKLPIPTHLHDAIIRPIVERIDEARRLIIAPDGALNLIPFGALYDGERYLVEKYTLRYVTTGRDLLKPAPPITTAPLAVVANPTGADLSGAEREAAFLAALFPDVRVLEREQATEFNVRALEHPLILHMATHGFFGEAQNDRDNPMLRSGLELADQVGDDRDLDDGQLTAYEVSGLDLRGTQLVVLSACETGLGKVEMGEGVLGLRRAFAMAGAQTQVMSLWKVGDVTAQMAMEAYYLELVKGKGRGEAMQEVQLLMLRTKEYAHPKDWAAFIVSGDDTPMVFPEGERPQEEVAEPPRTESSGGCATRRSSRGAPTGLMLVGLLGLTGLRRRDR